MQVKETKLKLLFVLKDIVNQQQLAVPAQQIILYPVSERQLEASEKLEAEDTHFDSTYNLVEDIIGTRESRGECEVRINCSGLDKEKEQT